jgi:hypothetical protein
VRCGQPRNNVPTAPTDASRLLRGPPRRVPTRSAPGAAYAVILRQPYMRVRSTERIQRPVVQASGARKEGRCVRSALGGSAPISRPVTESGGERERSAGDRVEEVAVPGGELRIGRAASGELIQQRGDPFPAPRSPAGPCPARRPAARSPPAAVPSPAPHCRPGASPTWPSTPPTRRAPAAYATGVPLSADRRRRDAATAVAYARHSCWLRRAHRVAPVAATRVDELLADGFGQ